MKAIRKAKRKAIRKADRKAERKAKRKNEKVSCLGPAAWVELLGSSWGPAAWVYWVQLGFTRSSFDMSLLWGRAAMVGRKKICCGSEEAKRKAERKAKTKIKRKAKR